MLPDLDGLDWRSVAGIRDLPVRAVYFRQKCFRLVWDFDFDIFENHGLYRKQNVRFADEGRCLLHPDTAVFLPTDHDAEPNAVAEPFERTSAKRQSHIPTIAHDLTRDITGFLL